MRTRPGTRAFLDEMTLAEARALLQTRVDEGVRCPCCAQRAQVYRRQIHSTMARSLILMYKKAGLQFSHIPDYLPRQGGGDEAKLRYWGLIEEEPSRRDDGSTRTGWWRVTAKGLDWLSGDITVPKYAHTYAGVCLRFSGSEVSIKDALGKSFNYNELMGEGG